MALEALEEADLRLDGSYRIVSDALAALRNALNAAPEPTKGLDPSPSVKAEEGLGDSEAAATPQYGKRDTFQLGDTVRKTKGSQWHGTVVGTYSTSLTPEGYAVENKYEAGSVQIYPAAALEKDE